MLRHRDRSDTGTAAAVRDAEGLVQVEVGDVTAEATGLCQSEQGVEVGAVDVDLTAVAVDEVAHVADALLVHPVRRGVGHHDRGQAVSLCLTLVTEVTKIDPAVIECGDHDNAHTGHHGRRGVRPVRARGIRQTSRSGSPRDWWYARMARSPASSPWLPAFGCTDTLA